MNFDDYFQLVKRYNPQQGLLGARRNKVYAKQLQASNLSVSQTIIQLLMDAREAKATERKSLDNRQKKSLSWQLGFLLGVSILSVISWVMR